MKRAFTLTATTALLTLAATGTASAAPTHVFIDGFAPHYFTSTKRAPDAADVFGRLDSTKQKCVVGRKVNVYFVQSGPDRKLGTDTSDSNGGWSLMILFDDFDPGDYYAKAPKSVLHDGTVCDADRSQELASV